MLEAVTLAQHAGPARSRVKPHVHRVRALAERGRPVLVGVREQVHDLADVPRVRAFLLHNGHDMIDGLLVHQRLSRLDVVKHRDGHAPRPLPRDAPVVAPLRHGRDPILSRLWDPLDSLDRVQRRLPEPVHRRKPLVRRPRDGRLLGPPVVGIPVLVRLLTQQRPRLPQRRNHRIRPLRLHLQPGKHPGLLGKPPRVVHGRQQLQTVLHAHDVIVLPVSRRRMHQPRPRIGGNIIPADHHRTRPIKQRMPVRRPLDLRPRERHHRLERRPELPLQRLLELLRDHQPFPTFRLHDRVHQRLVHPNRQIRGDGPRRRRPHRNLRPRHRLPLLLPHPRPHPDHLKPDVNTLTRVPVRILQLGLRQRRPRTRAPIHRLAPPIHVPVRHHLPKHPQLRRLVLGLQRHIRRLPVPPHPVPLELLPLTVHRLQRKRLCLLPQRDRRQPRPLLALHALQHLELDRQPVRIPPRHIPRLFPLQQLIPVDKILQDLIQRVPNMQVPVCIRRAVMKHVRLALALNRQLLVNPVGRPKLLNLRLADDRVCPHIKGRRRKVDGLRVRRFLLLLLVLLAAAVAAAVAGGSSIRRGGPRRSSPISRRCAALIRRAVR